MRTETSTASRLNMIDTLRGFAIISMIIYHSVWICAFFGLGLSFDTLYGPVCTFWERSICMGFIFISGFSFSLGKNHFKNALTAFSLGILITLTTSLLVPEIKIVFGILTFLGTACFLMILFDKVFCKVSSYYNIILAIVFLILFIIFYHINKGILGVGDFAALELPKNLYNGYFMTFLGFTDPGFYSADYFSLFPWIFLYILGYLSEKITRNTAFRSSVLTKGIPAISFLGRHSLIIYILHPIIIYILVSTGTVLFNVNGDCFLTPLTANQLN